MRSDRTNICNQSSLVPYLRHMLRSCISPFCRLLSSTKYNKAFLSLPQASSILSPAPIVCLTPHLKVKKTTSLYLAT